MKREKGVYALVMRLERDRVITVGRLGTFEFPKGWYVYLGSAHGPGGVKRRTDRHRREDAGKRKKWNVDYLRPYAPISEIWFSHAPAYREHDWAWKVMRMSGATIPARKFGANDCYPRCETHLFHFPRRPLLAEFRADLLRTAPNHPPIYVEFVEPLVSDPIQLDGEPIPTLRQYDRGRRFLTIRHRAFYDGVSDIERSDTKISWAKGSFDGRLAEQVARSLKVSTKQLIQDVEFAQAVETLVLNCDEDVFDILFAPKRPQSRDAIMRLSRVSDNRQRHRIVGVGEGRFRSVAPQNDDPVFDTISFGEVTSRLFRARGAIRKLQVLLRETRNTEVVLESRRLAKLCDEAADCLSEFLKCKQVKEKSIPEDLRKAQLWPILMSRKVRGTVVGKARLALRLTVKSVWDYPEMQQRYICPSQKQRETVIEEIEQIREIARAILVDKNIPSGA